MPNVGPKVKLSRKLGVSLTPKSSLVMLHKPYGPGQHGQRRSGRRSDYGLQLLEKQKLKYQYNISERQLRNYYREANQIKGNTADNLLRILDSRLDAVVLRAGFAPTVYAARQLVSHAHVMVDGKIVNFPGFRVTSEMEISIKEKSRNIPFIAEALQTTEAPPYVEVQAAEYKCKLARVPEREEVPIICEIPQVVEYYSR